MERNNAIHIVHGPDKFFIISRGTKRHHVFQQAYYPHIVQMPNGHIQLKRVLALL